MIAIHPWQLKRVNWSSAIEYSNEVAKCNSWVLRYQVYTDDIDILDEAIVQYAFLRNLTMSQLAHF